MTRIKIFWNNWTTPDIEEQVNDWLKENTEVDVISINYILNSSNDESILIYYKVLDKEFI